MTMRLCVSNAASGLEEGANHDRAVLARGARPRGDEPQAAQEYAAVLTQVVAAGRPVIVPQRARAWRPSSHWSTWSWSGKSWRTPEVERSAAEIDWTRAGSRDPPPTAIVLRAVRFDP